MELAPSRGFYFWSCKRTLNSLQSEARNSQGFLPSYQSFFEGLMAPSAQGTNLWTTPTSATNWKLPRSIHTLAIDISLCQTQVSNWDSVVWSDDRCQSIKVWSLYYLYILVITCSYSLHLIIFISWLPTNVHLWFIHIPPWMPSNRL